MTGAKPLALLTGAATTTERRTIHDYSTVTTVVNMAVYKVEAWTVDRFKVDNPDYPMACLTRIIQLLRYKSSDDKVKGNPAMPGGLFTSKPMQANAVKGFVSIGFCVVLRMRGRRTMTGHIWAILGVIGVSFPAVVIVITLLWRQIPLHHWYCRRCKKIVTCGRFFHPRKCACGSNTLVAYICDHCGSWHTSPTAGWHCQDCTSKNVDLGVEYRAGTAMWRWRNAHTARPN